MSTFNLFIYLFIHEIISCSIILLVCLLFLGFESKTFVSVLFFRWNCSKIRFIETTVRWHKPLSTVWKQTQRGFPTLNVTSKILHVQHIHIYLNAHRHKLDTCMYRLHWTVRLNVENGKKQLRQIEELN